MGQELKFAVVTCSDTRTIEEDTAGAALEQLIADNGWECASRVIVKDERADIAAAIVEACDVIDADIVLTCGGSGLSLHWKARTRPITHSTRIAISRAHAITPNTLPMRLRTPATSPARLRISA